MEIVIFVLCLSLKNARNLGNDFKNGRQNFSRENVEIFVWCCEPRQNLGEMTKKRSSEILRRKCGNLFGGPRTETKFVKWSASRKRLRTTGLEALHDA